MDRFRLRYSTGLAPPGIVGFMGLMAVLGIVTFVLTVLEGQPAWILLAYLAVVTLVGYGFLWVLCYEVVIESGVFRWRAAFRHGEERMDEAVRVGTWGPMGDVHVFLFRDGARVRVPVVQRYLAFLDELHREYPDLPLPSTGYARFVDRLRFPGPGRRNDRPAATPTMTEGERTSRRRLADDALSTLRDLGEDAAREGAALADRFVNGDVDLEQMLGGIRRLRER